MINTKLLQYVWYIQLSSDYRNLPAKLVIAILRSAIMGYKATPSSMEALEDCKSELELYFLQHTDLAESALLTDTIMNDVRERIDDFKTLHKLRKELFRLAHEHATKLFGKI